MEVGVKLRLKGESATAEIVAPLSLVPDADSALDFGTMVTDTAGTVTVTAAGAPTANGPKLLVGSTSSADSFTVSGDACG